MNQRILTALITGVAMCLFLGAFSVQAEAQKPTKKAKNLVKQGNALYNQNRLEDALKKYEDAVKISPNYPEARFFMGNSHFKLAHFADSIKELNLAQSQGYSELDVATVRMEAYFEVEDIDAAITDAKTAIRLAPQSSYFHTFLGRMQLIKEDYPNAAASFKLAIELGERSADVHYYQAVAYGASGNYIEQGKSAREALKRGTGLAGDCWYLVGDSELRAKLYSDAVQSFTNSINAYKSDIESNRATADTEENLYLAYSDLADSYRNLNRYEDAIDAAKAGLSLRPDDGNLHTSLAWYYSISGQTDYAVTAGQKAVELDGGKYMAHTNLCRAYNDRGAALNRARKTADANASFKKAIESCNRALKLEPEDGETNYYLGLAYFYLDNKALSDSHYRKSVGALEKFTKDNPNYSDGFYLLGNAYFATGQNDKAIAAYVECLRITPRFARVKYNLGFVYLRSNKKDLARVQYDELKPLDPELAAQLLDVITKG